MFIPDNRIDVLSIYADWLEDQGIDTKEFREELEFPFTNSWCFEYFSASIGGGGGGRVGNFFQSFCLHLAGSNSVYGCKGRNIS